LKEIFNLGLSEVTSRLQKSVLDISSRIKGVAALVNLEDESTESKKAFYLLSVLLLIFFIFLSPDKLPQAFAHAQADIGFFERVHELTKIIRKLIPSLS